MKLIIAYVQPERMEDVKQALSDADVTKMSITNSLGCGQQGGYTETYRGVDMEVNLLQKVRFEVAVNDEFADATIKAIIKGAKTGNIGDGKIFVLTLDDCIRIRTEETGKDAIG
ncbi:MAG TPA: P-II family nitrogen regulator [Spirochaetota bacterium]|nr:P-II family nitrogen regulator [Spirochaetota bacterium]HPJ40175.1 P-II family nitrogen regulator [Spirochaetota bacterium]HPQ55323.1 P-II family nitrogen regulator [Spirochaetota bacterium]